MIFWKPSERAWIVVLSPLEIRPEVGEDNSLEAQYSVTHLLIRRWREVIVFQTFLARKLAVKNSNILWHYMYMYTIRGTADILYRNRYVLFYELHNII